MTAKERLFAALAFEETDRTPAFTLDGSAWLIGQEGICFDQQLALEDYGAAMIVKRFEELNNDIVFAACTCGFAWTTAFGAKIDASRVGRAAEVEPCIFDLEKDIPDLTDEQIKEVLCNNYYIDRSVKQLREVKKLVGEEKSIGVCLGGPFTGAANLLGPGEFMKQIAKRNKQIPNLIAFAGRVSTILTKLYSENGADIFLIAEPVASGDMIAPRTFKQFVTPYFQKYMESLEGKIPVILHICGKSGLRLAEVKSFGVKAFSIDSMVDMEEMLAGAEHQLCIMGSLSPSEQMVQGTPDSVYEESMRLLKLAQKNGGGLLLSSGCEFPAGAPVENARAMVQASIDFSNGIGA